MDSPLNQPPDDSGGQAPAIELPDERTDEKITIDIGEEIGCRIDQIPDIIQSFNAWSKQWE